MFDWNDLKFFLELARQGRLMPAARRLKVDHTTVAAVSPSLNAISVLKYSTESRTASF